MDLSLIPSRKASANDVTARACFAAAARREGRLVLSMFALPKQLRVTLSDFFRRVIRALISCNRKAVPCNGALLGMRRTVQEAWCEPTCQLIPHDDDVDCFYTGAFAKWQAVDWHSFGCVFTDLRADASCKAGVRVRVRRLWAMLFDGTSLDSPLHLKPPPSARRACPQTLACMMRGPSTRYGPLWNSFGQLPWTSSSSIAHPYAAWPYGRDRADHSRATCLRSTWPSTGCSVSMAHTVS